MWSSPGPITQDLQGRPCPRRSGVRSGGAVGIAGALRWWFRLPTGSCGSVYESVAGPRYQPRYVLSIPVSSPVAPRGRLDSAKVHHIRTAALTDSHLARLYGVTIAAIRDARVGDTWPDHPTPPDKTSRTSWGRRGSPKARSSKEGTSGGQP